jgi:Flp pilus assembly protein CpaB
MVAKIPDGYRAVAIQVDEIVGVGGFVKPGARVDVVIVMTGQSKNQNISRVILQNVEVLAVGQETEMGSQGAAVTRSVTVLVRPEDASKLHLASTKGKLRLALRSQDDHREPKPVMLTDEDLLTDGTSARRRGAEDNSVFGLLFGNLSKPNKSKVDVKAAPDVAKATPEQKDWEVEVMSGTEVYKVKFDSAGQSVGQMPAGPQSAGKSKPSGTRGVIVSGGIERNTAGPAATATPSAGGVEDGGAEQDRILEAPENAGE